MIDIESFDYKRDVYQAKAPKAIVILAHGAGAGNQHEFIKHVANQISNCGFTVSAMNFPYMETAYELDKRRPPNRAPQLLDALVEEINWLQQNLEPNLDIFIIGKSMGGRMATLLAASPNLLDGLNTTIKGVVALGYPFHPPGKIEKLQERISHFDSLTAPLCILQGERDTFGNRKLIEETKSLNTVNIQWLVDGDHSFKPKKSSPVTEIENIKKACDHAVEFMLKQL